MGALFLHPGFLIIAAALVSVPIIIHLINRMRFKRIRWAAMEFLLKAQKRTRRRLIIEQLLLLALRCLMIALVGFLVSRFIGCGESGVGGKPNLHLVLLDDTPSMQDQWKEDAQFKNCFDIAKNDVLSKKIAKGLSVSKTTDQLIILPLSRVDDPTFEIKNATYERLNDEKNLKKLQEDINELQPSMVHVSMMQGIKKAQTIIDQYSESHVTLHVIGDYRDKDWGGQQGDGLLKELVDLAKIKKGEIKIRVIDTVHPARAATQGGFPPSRDNVGIVDLAPSTRIVGKNMPVRFTVRLQNFGGGLAEVDLVARNELTGADMFEVSQTQSPPNPVKISPSSSVTVTFEHRFNPQQYEANGSHYGHLSVRLTTPQRGPLENDGLHADNIRHTVVEVREKVPILVVDGDLKGKEEGKDSFFLSRSLQSVPGASYQVVFADEVSPGKPAAVLERPDLNKYPTIFILNMPTLSPKQIANLENYVKEGGGVGFFLGPLVNGGDYNRQLYRDGKGIFPAPVKLQYFPGPAEPPLEPKGVDTLQLITRDEEFKNDPAGTPIFGSIFEEPKHREPLRDLPIRRYWQVQRSQWKREPGKVFELATLPNDAPATQFQESVADITQRGESIKNILKEQKFGKYKTRVEHHISRLAAIAQPGSDAKAFQLANQIEAMLNDKGSAKAKDDMPDLTDLWSNSDPNVRTIVDQLKTLRTDVLYGDPFMVLQKFGKGKVVAVMSTAGKDWNDFAGGSASSVLFAPFIWETQNYLSSQGAEANLTTGTNLEIALDSAQFKGAQLKLVRKVNKTEVGKEAKKVAHGDPQFGREDGTRILFSMTRHNEPGVYVSELIDENNAAKGPISVYAHAFNIDTAAEGDLARVSSDKLEQEFAKTEGTIIMVNPNAPEGTLVSKLNDFSESPWLFLMILLVLVAEQALAVHLSFHMKNQENEMTPAGASRGNTTV